METLAIQDTQNTQDTHSFFDSKEHYLKFRASWKKYIADDKHRCRTYTDGQGGTCKYDSDLTTVHHLIYNGLRKCDLHKMFSPMTRETKLDMYGGDPYAAYHDARSELQWCGKCAGNIDKILEPFGDTVTKRMLAELGEALRGVEL